MLRDRLRRQFRQQMFFPGALGLLVNPFWIARRALLRGVASLSSTLEGRLLDIGCGTKPYRSLFDVDDYVGLEIDRPETRELGIADAFYDGKLFPFPDESFDSIVCSQVLEHVFEPEAFLDEVARVLKPGGHFLFTVPFVWDEHEQPWDFARYTSFGLRALFDRHGLQIAHHTKLVDDASLMFQLFNAYLFKVLSKRPTWVKRIANVVVMAPISAIGFLVGRLLPSHPDLYLDQVVSGVRR